MVHSTKLAKGKPHMIEIDTQVRILSQDYLIESFQEFKITPFYCKIKTLAMGF